MAKVAAPAKVENLPSEWEGKDVLAQPVQAINKNCLMPYVVTKGKAKVSVHLINPTENFVTFKSGTLLGNLVEVKKVYEEDNPDEDVPFLDDDISVRVLKTPKAKSTTKDSSPTNEDDVDANIASNVTTSDDAPLPMNLPLAERVLKSQEIKQVYDAVPPHLKDLFERSIVNLYDDQAIVLGKTLIVFSDVFAKSDFDIGCFSGGIVHDIDTGDCKPVTAHMRPTNPQFREEEGKLLTKLKAINVIQPSTSDWASAPVLIRKKDGSVCYYIDYHKLTEWTVKTVATLPLISECLDSLAGNLWCSTVDWNSGYYQLWLNPRDRHKTAFITKYGLFEFLCMSFGLCNAPSTFQRVVQFIFAGMLWKEVLAYLDDLFILGKGFQHHLINLRKTFCRLKKYNLKLKPRKCILFQTEVPFLGRVVGRKGISVDPGKIKATQKWPSPRTIKELQSFLGFVNYHRDHIKNFASLTEPLYALTHNRKGKSQTLEWNDDLETTFLQVKDALVNAPVLAFPLPKGNSS